jgi:hypothetical protein
MKDIEVDNVARRGRAWQSSISKWSQPDDAERALDGDNRLDFSFHTDQDQIPWWIVDFGRSYPIERIVIGNRRKGYQERARSLCIEISDDKCRWIQVYGGLNYWGLFLTVNLESEFSARYVRLSLKEKNYLHLVKVEVFVRTDFLNLLPHKMAVAQRNDGLGERLNSMVNAISLAKAFNIDFKFVWPSRLVGNDEHAIEAAEEFFDADFIKSFKIDKAPSALWEPDDTALTVMSARDKLTKLNGFIGPRLPLIGIFDKAELPKLKLDLPGAFNSIKFSPRISAVIDRARSFPLEENAVGMHLRAGDVFFGDYRKRVLYTYKGLNLPIAKAMLRKLQADGKNVYLFGQDEEVICYLCERYEAKSLAAIDPSTKHLGKVEKAMYDLVAMSRFPIIAAGSSGFAKQAQWIGGSVVKHPRDFFTPKQQHQIILDDLTGNAEFYHPKQTAFAYWYAYYVDRKNRPMKDNIFALEQAAKYDPSNELYCIVLAHCALKIGELESARSWLVAAIGDGSDFNKLALGIGVLTGRTGKVYNLQEYLPEFINSIDKMPHAAFIAWAFSVQSKRPEEAERFKAAAGNTLDLLFQGASVLLA